MNPGPGALLTGMSPDELITQLEKNLEDVPGVSGVNNHMGSRLTTEATQMYQIFTILKKRDLFFVDPSPHTVHSAEQRPACSSYGSEKGMCFWTIFRKNPISPASLPS